MVVGSLKNLTLILSARSLENFYFLDAPSRKNIYILVRKKFRFGVVGMNLTEVSVVLSVLAAMVSIPFATSTVSIDNSYGLAVILNTTPDSVNSSQIPSAISKTITQDGITYSYRTPYGEFVISISPEKFEETLLKVGKKVTAVQGSTEQVWEISLPSESLKINHSEQRIVETYRNIHGYLEITTENGYQQIEMSGTATQEELEAGMRNLERELNETVAFMEEMSEKILNISSGEAQPREKHIVINEFESNPEGADAGREWIELYNPTPVSVNISGWRIYNKNLDFKTIGNVTIEAGGYYVLNATGLTLYNSDEQLTLKNNETVVDATPPKSDDANNNKCWARVPNGADTDSESDWTFQICTRGTSNDG